MALKNGGPNLVRRKLDVGANGAPTDIIATGPTRGFRIRESTLTKAGAANIAQGFWTRIPNDGTANGFTDAFERKAPSATSDPDRFSFENWNRISEFGPHGEAFAGPGGAIGAGGGTLTGTKLCDVQSATATPTTIEIVEYF